MDFALYDPERGYYARSPQRSGRAGDFFTSVDVGPLFGELLAVQVAEMAAYLATAWEPRDTHAVDLAAAAQDAFDLVEAGAGNGRLSADILRALRSDFPEVYERVRLHLVEVSAAARGAQASTLGDLASRVASSSASLPETFAGILVANELLDALPTHQVVMREDGLREIYVDEEDGALVSREGPPSTPALEEYLAEIGVRLEPGWRVEVNLRAVEWMRNAARRLKRGFLIVIDYGHEAGELYSAAHSSGTLTAFRRGRESFPGGGRESFQRAEPGQLPGWLVAPGSQDITAHVNFTSVRQAAAREGAVPLAFLDQTYFLMGLAVGRESFSAPSTSIHGRTLALVDGMGRAENDSRPRAFKTLILPGGLGSTMKVLVLGKGVGRPALRGTSYRVRVT
jgi:SAM-dependent MidA family methyltransferase